MKMSAPAPRNAIDENRQGLIGKPINRVDGRLKVMGKAPYAHEVDEGGQAVYGFIVEATIAKGTVTHIDTAAAERAAGVLLVMTHRNAPKQGAWGPLSAKDRYARGVAGDFLHAHDEVAVAVHGAGGEVAGGGVRGRGEF